VKKYISGKNGKLAGELNLHGVIVRRPKTKSADYLPTSLLLSYKI
jgi:hypothetical protein